jgi:hypothetical protein
MGRGRAKAKQTKVARELKYSAPSMDLTRLQRDLHSDDPLLGKSRSSESVTAGSDDEDGISHLGDEDEDSPADSAVS